MESDRENDMKLLRIWVLSALSGMLAAGCAAGVIGAQALRASMATIKNQTLCFIELTLSPDLAGCAETESTADKIVHRVVE